MANDVIPPIGWLLLRAGHSVPISGLSPDELKASRGVAIERAGVPLKTTSGYNAIVHCLGFEGDFGDYKAKHWPLIQRIMSEHGLRECRNLFEVPDNDLTFGLMQYRRRALADRLFFGGTPMPRRAFIGYGHAWGQWDELFYSVPGGFWTHEDDRFAPVDAEHARRWIYSHRFELFGNLTFFSDHLLDLGRSGRFEVAEYFGQKVPAEIRDRDIARQRKVADVFRWFIDQREDGWIQIIQVTSALVLLKGPSGTYDLLWRNLRLTPPPTATTAQNPLQLHPMDMPSSLLAAQDFEAWNYYRLDAWDEKERHDANLHYYASAASSAPDPAGSNGTLERYLRHKRVYGQQARLPKGRNIPDGYRTVKLLDGRSLLVSDLVTVGAFRQFAQETGYLDRRDGEDWTAANDDNPESAPVGATLQDALAYAAWTERSMGVALRLFTAEEHRALRPFESEHYQKQAGLDFLWEHWPPRFGLEASVLWSEPRFLDPMAENPEFPSSRVTVEGSTKRWIAPENWPPRARWREPIPWAEHAGLRFIDAWDAYEWCSDGHIAGRYWQGLIGSKSWGEYKNIKVGFRLVIDPESGNG